jgi:hypothetical protein
MAKQKELFLTKGANLSSVVFTATDTTATKSVIAAGADDTRITSLTATNTTASAAIVRLYLYNGTTDFLIGSISVAANAGFNGTIAQSNLFNLTDMPGLELNNAGMPSILLKGTWSIRASLSATLGAGNLTINAIAEDF